MRWPAIRFGACICINVKHGTVLESPANPSVDGAQESFELSHENIGADLQS